MAVDPLPRAGVLNVPGAPIVEIARQAEMFRPLAILQMRARRPSLMNGEKDFTESLPLWGEPPVTVPSTGALAIQAYFARAEWLQESADPSAFAPYLREAPLMPAGPRPAHPDGPGRPDGAESHDRADDPRGRSPTFRLPLSSRHGGQDVAVALRRPARLPHEAGSGSRSHRARRPGADRPLL